MTFLLVSHVIRNEQEILVTRSNLEDKNTLMVELKNKVDELALHNEYQLRLKDMNYSEKIKVRAVKKCLGDPPMYQTQLSLVASIPDNYPRCSTIYFNFHTCCIYF